MKITLAFITAREQPQLDWLIDGLAKQTQKRDEIELIVVDAFGRPARSIGYRSIPTITRLVETRPKPTIWQGPHRITAHDFFANANARNTALVLCTTDYICFVDDRCKPDRKWLAQVRRGESTRDAVICGPCDRHEDWGVLVDHRRTHESKGKKGCSGGWCYGGNHALPLEWALEVNGFEEGCDPVGLEDCAFGHMLENAGHRVDFVVEMALQLDRRGLAHPFAFPRQDKGEAPHNKSHAIQERFFARTRTEFTPDLRQLRQRVGRGESFPTPGGDPRDWYDAAPIRGMRLSVEELIARAEGKGEVVISGRKRP